MLLGICSGFAVVPTLSLVNGDGGGTARGWVTSLARPLGLVPHRAVGPVSEGRAGLGAGHAVGAVGAVGAEPPSAEPPSAEPPSAEPGPEVLPGPGPAIPSPPSPTRLRRGVATWLDTIPAGTCASNDAPMGSTITVTGTAGRSIRCKVVSTGPFVTGRIVDLAKPTFAALGSVSRGLVSVSVTW